MYQAYQAHRSVHRRPARTASPAYFLLSLQIDDAAEGITPSVLMKFGVAMAGSWRSYAQCAGRHEAFAPRAAMEQTGGRSLRNVAFAEFRRFIESFGFRLRLVSGSH